METTARTVETAEKKAKPKSKDYPAITLEKAIEFVSKFKDFPPNKPIAYETAAKECNVNSGTKSFRYAISAARQFGLIATSSGLTFTLLKPAQRLIRPMETDSVLRAVKVECFSAPKLYSELISAYSGKSIPAVSTLENVLVTYHGILPAVSKVAATNFIDTANEVGVIRNGVLDLTCESPLAEMTETPESESADKDSQEGDIPTPKDIHIDIPAPKGEFAAPLNISFGDERRAILYMPIDASQEDATYVKDMISLMFKRVYKVTDDKQNDG